MKMTDTFLFTCKENYYLGIYPGDPNSKSKNGYKELLNVAQQYFDKNLYEDFSYFFMEGQYLISLWAAHLILEYGEPGKTLADNCLSIIKEYSNSPLNPVVAELEKNWLNKYNNKQIDIE